jgi:outer membrane biosynthesis protein TonB
MLALGFQSRRVRSRALFNSIFCLMFCVIFLAAGCEKKPARVVPAVLAPTIETEPPAPPPPAAGETSSAPEPAPANTPDTSQQKPKPKPRKPVPRRPAPAPQQPVADAPKVEQPRPATPNNSVQITADVPRAAVQSQRQSTEYLLRNSEGKLGQLTRGLSDGEQGMLRQARNYIAQSHQALQTGDVERAYNLAVKASLLANELAK